MWCAQVMNPPKVSCSGTVRAIKFCDSEAAFWQMAQQHGFLHHAHSGSSHPHLGMHPTLRLIPPSVVIFMATTTHYNLPIK